MHCFMRHDVLEPAKLVGSVRHILASLIDKTLGAHRLVADRGWSVSECGGIRQL